MSFITEYEKRVVAYIESQMIDKKVKLWADAFSNENTAKTRTQIFFGHQKTDRLGHLIRADNNEIVYLKRYYLELRVEIFTLKNHQEGLDIIETVLDDVLSGYTPYQEFSRFVAETSGDASRNKVNGSWIYTGVGYTEIYSDVENLTPILPVLPEGKIISIGLYNAMSDVEPDNSQIGLFIHE